VGNLTAEFFFFVFISCCGVLQFVASYRRLKGISFFQRTISGYLFAVLAIAGAYCWFFIAENRHAPGLEGAEVFALFIAGSLAAFIFTACLSSVIKRKLHLSMEQDNPGEKPGLDSLRRMTYFQAIAGYFRNKDRG